MVTNQSGKTNLVYYFNRNTQTLQITKINKTVINAEIKPNRSEFFAMKTL